MCRGLTLGSGTVCEEQSRLLLPLPVTFATVSSSPGWPHPGSVNIRQKGLEKGESQEGERPDPAAEAADLGGPRKLPQLQPVPVATCPVGAGVPSLVHSLRRALDRPVPSGLGGIDLTHVPRLHMAVGSSRRRSRRPLEARHSLKDGLPTSELVSATTRAGDGLEGAKHPHSKAK